MSSTAWGTRGSGRAGIPAARKVSIYASALVRRRSTRSHIGARASSAASSSVQRSGQSVRSRSASQPGEAWRAAGLLATSSSSVRRSRRYRRSTALTSPPARPPPLLATFTAASTTAYSGVRASSSSNSATDNSARTGKLSDLDGLRQQAAENRLVAEVSAHRSVTERADRRRGVRGRRESSSERLIERDALVQDSRDRMDGERARIRAGSLRDGSAHGLVNRAPLRRCALMNSPAAMGLRPASCSRVMRSTPSPHATAMPSDEAASTVPGGPARRRRRGRSRPAARAAPRPRCAAACLPSGSRRRERD